MTGTCLVLSAGSVVAVILGAPISTFSLMGAFISIIALLFVFSQTAFEISIQKAHSKIKQGKTLDPTSASPIERKAFMIAENRKNVREHAIERKTLEYILHAAFCAILGECVSSLFPVFAGAISLWM